MELSLNCKHINSREERKLLKSIAQGRPDSFIIPLIQNGYDNFCNKTGEKRPIHLAVYHGRKRIVHALIKYGTNLNALDKSKESPLYYAVEFSDLEMISMLLYYGADTSIGTSDNRSLLMLAAQCRKIQVFESLIRYYEDYSCIIQGNELHEVASRLDSLHFFSCWIACEGPNCEDTFFLKLSMFCGIPKLFKIIWNRINHKMLLVGDKPFLVTYWNTMHPSVTTSNWLECLNLILSSTCADKFVEHCKNYYKHLYLPKLIQAFEEYGVKRNDRIAVLYLLFSLGAEVCCSDIDWVSLHHGFNEEFEACIYAGNYSGKSSDIYTCDSPFLTFIFGLEEECSIERVFELLQHWPPDLCHYYKFFSLYSNMKSELKESWKERRKSDNIFRTSKKAPKFYYTGDMSKELSQMSDFPSLLELSRNAAQNLIRKMYGNKIRKPYDFHDVVKGLNLPEDLKNVILFKRPIYN